MLVIKELSNCVLGGVTPGFCVLPAPLPTLMSAGFHPPWNSPIGGTTSKGNSGPLISSLKEACHSGLGADHGKDGGFKAAESQS